MDEADDTGFFRFNHPRNITVGHGRIVWTNGGYDQSPGYALPGGGRTLDEKFAREVAGWIDAVIRRSLPKASN